MKQLQNNFTTPEQSKRLLEIGVPADSADCHYTAMQSMIWVNNDNDPDFTNKLIIPCWSVGRLMEIYDICRRYDGDWDEVYGKETYIETYISAIEEAVLDEMLDFSKLEE